MNGELFILAEILLSDKPTRLYYRGASVDTILNDARFDFTNKPECIKMNGGKKLESAEEITARIVELKHDGFNIIDNGKVCFVR